MVAEVASGRPLVYSSAYAVTVSLRAIVRSAVAHHGGEATLARGEDGGTVLTLRVPACAQEAAGA